METRLQMQVNLSRSSVGLLLAGTSESAFIDLALQRVAIRWTWGLPISRCDRISRKRLRDMVPAVGTASGGGGPSNMQGQAADQ